MSTIVKAGLIQCSNPLNDPSAPPGAVKRAAIDAHLPLIEKAGAAGVRVLCLQELFYGPYFPPSQDSRWFALAEPVPGPTTEEIAALAARHSMAMIVPVMERTIRGLYYNTAAVIGPDGGFIGKYRKVHLPQVAGFWEKFFFRPGNLGFPVFDLGFAKIGVYTCYDRHFPEGARALGLKGAEIVFNPSATVDGLSRYLWKLEQPAHAVANGYFMGCVNRVGTEPPWNIGKFYGTSYFVDPRGRTVAEGSEDGDELVFAELDLTLIDETRNLWQFYRDRKPEAYGDLTADAP